MMPLADLVVLEAPRPDAPRVHRLALALAGKMAAELGARVIKAVPPGGDPLHRVPVLPWEQDRNPQALARFLDNSKSLHTTVSTSAGDADGYAMLAAEANVILTDDPVIQEELSSATGSRKVVCALASFPAGSALNDVPVSEITLLALSGILDIVGDPEREPLMLGGHQAGYAGGLAMFSAMMTGVARLENQGVGDFFDVNIWDVLAWVNWKNVASSYFKPGEKTTREGAAAEWRVVKAKDGWIALVFNQRDWPSLANMIGGALLEDPGLATRSGRAAQRAEYMSVVEAWCRQRTREQIYRQAQEARIPIGPVVEPYEMPDDPHFAARQVITESLDSGFGAFRSPALPVRWNENSPGPIEA